eukprot:s689_g24.t1
MKSLDQKQTKVAVQLTAKLAMARDRIPVITSTRGTPHSSYPGSPARHGDTPRAIPCPEPSLSTTLLAPVAPPEPDAGPTGPVGPAGPAGPSGPSEEPTSPGRMAMILQQLPVLQAELAKAHETQGQQAHQLHSVRKELELVPESFGVPLLKESRLLSGSRCSVR